MVLGSVLARWRTSRQLHEAKTPLEMVPQKQKSTKSVKGSVSIICLTHLRAVSLPAQMERPVTYTTRCPYERARARWTSQSTEL